MIRGTLVAWLAILCMMQGGAAGAIIIDDFTVGPALDTRPPYSSNQTISVSQEGLDVNHVWAGARFIDAGDYGPPGPSFPEPITTMATIPSDGGHFVYYSETRPETMGFNYAASANPFRDVPVVVAPLDFSVPGARLVLDVDYARNMGGWIFFRARDVNGDIATKSVPFPDSVNPFSLTLDLESTDGFDHSAVMRLRLNFSQQNNAALSLDNIVFVPEPTGLISLMTGALLCLLAKARWRCP